MCALVEAGDTPGRNPLLAPLRSRLQALGTALDTWDPTRCTELPLRRPLAGLYLVKGDHPSVLSVAGMLTDAGASCLNSHDATAAAADKARTLARIARAGVPVPRTVLADGLATLAAQLQQGPRFVKPLRGAHGEGTQVLRRGEGPSTPGPWLVQECVDGPGYDLKVYGVGRQAAVRRVHTQPGVVGVPREPVLAAPAVTEIALEAATAARLDCWGVDVVAGRDGPVVVDVNAFPGYRGVPEAIGWLTDLILERLQSRR
ncbi:MAG: RimK family alpha-L-glutamate ligase [Nitriliruptorales bacterium]